MVAVFLVGALFFAYGIAGTIMKRRTRRDRAALRRSAIEWSENGSGMRSVWQTTAPGEIPLLKKDRAGSIHNQERQ